MLITTFCLLDG